MCYLNFFYLLHIYFSVKQKSFEKMEYENINYVYLLSGEKEISYIFKNAWLQVLYIKYLISISFCFICTFEYVLQSV